MHKSVQQTVQCVAAMCMGLKKATNHREFWENSQKEA